MPKPRGAGSSSYGSSSIDVETKENNNTDELISCWTTFESDNIPER